MKLFLNLHCIGRGQKHGWRRKGSKDHSCERCEKVTLKLTPKTGQRVSCLRTWRPSTEPQPSSPLVLFRPSPLSVALQLSSPSFLFDKLFQTETAPDGMQGRHQWASWCKWWLGPLGHLTTCYPSARAGSVLQTLGLCNIFPVSTREDNIGMKTWNSAGQWHPSGWEVPPQEAILRAEYIVTEQTRKA